MRLTCRITGIPAVVMLLLSVSVFAMDRNQTAEFTRMMHMSLGEMTMLARNSLKKNYPEEDWNGFHFPSFVFTNESVETGYKIAVKKPELLAKIGESIRDNSILFNPCSLLCWTFLTFGMRNLDTSNLPEASWPAWYFL